MRKIGAVLLFIVLLLSMHPASGLAKKQYTFGVSYPTSDNMTWVSIAKFTLEAIENAGHKPVIVWAEGNQAKQLTDVEDLLMRGVDGILLGPVNYEGSAPVVEACAKRKVPVVLVGRASASDKYISRVTVDDEMFGVWQAIYLTSALAAKGGAKIVYLYGPAGASYPEDQWRGFKKIIDRHPEIQLLERFISPTDLIADGLRIMEDALIRFPKIDAVCGSNDDLVLGAIGAAEAAGRHKEMVFLGNSGVPMGMQAVYDGRMHYLGCRSTGNLAQVSVNTMIDYLEGKKIDRHIVLQPILVIKENVLLVRDAKFGGTLANPGTFQPQKK
ncbi:MAG: sugar ABC transporter substrate-binding protein [Bacillota bacterium]